MEVERRYNSNGKLITVSEASVKASIAGGEEVWSVAEGNGPVNALDQALRKDLGRYQGIIKDVELVDYKVRILTGGTEAVTRVLVESRDKATGERWFTVGVSPNIVDASFEALIDSITYKLLRSGAVALIERGSVDGTCASDAADRKRVEFRVRRSGGAVLRRAQRTTGGSIMSFRIKGLPAEQFEHLFALLGRGAGCAGAVRRDRRWSPARLSLPGEPHGLQAGRRAAARQLRASSGRLALSHALCHLRAQRRSRPTMRSARCRSSCASARWRCGASTAAA